MTTFIEPDVTQYPDNFQAIICPGLEALTGADMVISRVKPNPLTNEVIPPNTEANVNIHIKANSLFIQIKIGYDITSFDQLHSSIARMQLTRIPKGQAILLPIGDYYEKDDLLRVRGKKDFGKVPFTTLETIYDMWAMRGGTVDPLPPKSTDDLQAWIDRKHKSLDKIENEGTKDIYPPKGEFLPDDIWQQVEEVNDGRRFLVSGIPNFGSKKANALFKYARENTSSSPLGLYHLLCLLTDEIKGKPVHKIPLWGDKSRKEFREQLGIRDDGNLYDAAWEATYFQGWQSALEAFSYRVKKEKSLSPKKLQEIFDELKTENEIPF